MLTIDEIKIEGEEDGFHLVIYTDPPRTMLGTPMGPQRFRIGLPDQFHAEVQRTIGRWLDEGEAARVTMPAASFAEDDFDEAGHDMSDIYDNREGK